MFDIKLKVNVEILEHGQKYVGPLQPGNNKTLSGTNLFVIEKKKSEGGGIISSAIKSKTAITVLRLPSCFKGELTSSYPSK